MFSSQLRSIPYGFSRAVNDRSVRSTCDLAGASPGAYHSWLSKFSGFWKETSSRWSTLENPHKITDNS
jgi:hypothetical protein